MPSDTPIEELLSDITEQNETPAGEEPARSSAASPDRWSGLLEALEQELKQASAAMRCCTAEYLFEADGVYYFLDTDSYETFEAGSYAVGDVLTDRDEMDCLVDLTLMDDTVVRVEKTPRPAPPKEEAPPSPHPRTERELLQLRMDRLIKAANYEGWHITPARELSPQTMARILRGVGRGLRREDIYGFYDTGIFGNGKTGILLTATDLRSNDRLMLSKETIPLDNIACLSRTRQSEAHCKVEYYYGTHDDIFVFLDTHAQYGLRELIKEANNVDLAAEGEYHDACQGDAGAQFRLSFHYANGGYANGGHMRSSFYAEQWMKTAAKQGYPGAALRAGNFCYDVGTFNSIREAMGWYQRAAEKENSAEAQYRLAVIYDMGNGVEQDREKSQYWLDLACKQNYKPALNYIGAEVALYGYARLATEGQGDQPEAMRLLRIGAALGHPEAEYWLGCAYGRDSGKSPEMAKKAADWWEKAANQGHSGARFRLGLCYWDGAGRPERKTSAFFLFEEAAEQGHAKAQFFVGYCYSAGKGGRKADKAEAARWYEKAAEQGLAQAQYFLGLCYLDGEGVYQDSSVAVSWCEKAAEQGLAAAQYMLGVCYWDGEGVKPDYARAKEWLRKAADQGDKNAIEFVRTHYI